LTSVLLSVALQLGVGMAQDPKVGTTTLHNFRRRGEAAQRFDAGRGRSRLPEVDLSLETPAEGVEEEEPLFLEGLAKMLRVHGGVGFQEKYSNNIFLRAGGAIPGRHTPGDFIHMISPSLHLETPSKRMPIKVDYTLDIIRAGQFEHFDTEEHNLSAVTDLKITPRLTLRISDVLQRAGVEPREPDATIVNYYSNESEASLTYNFGERGRVQGGFRHGLARFDLRRFRSSEYDTDTVFVKGYHRILPRVGVIAETSHEWVDNKEFMIDNERDRVGGGLQWDITSRLKGSALLGYEILHLESSPNDHGLYGHAELVYDYSRQLRFGLYADRSLRETTLVAENVSYGRAFDDTQLTLNSIYKITRRISFLSGVFAIIDDYKTPPYGVKRFLISSNQDSRARKDDLFGFSLGLRWQPSRYVSLGATYEHQKNRSNIRRPDFDYEEGVFLLNASLGF